MLVKIWTLLLKHIGVMYSEMAVPCCNSAFLHPQVLGSMFQLWSKGIGWNFLPRAEEEGSWV